MTTLREIFEQTVRKYPKKEALYDVRLNKRWTYEEWDEEVNCLAQALQQVGVGKGDRVSTFLYNTSEFAITLFACTKIGAVFNPINFRLEPREVEYIIRDASPKVFIFERAVEAQLQPIVQQFPNVQFWSIDESPPEYAKSYHEMMHEAEPIRPEVALTEEDTYTVMYTSGTTGQPKGVVHRHRDMVDQSMIMIGAMRLSPRDRGLTVAPMFHCAELHCAFLPRVHIGASNVVMHHFEPKEVLRILETERVSSFFAAPTMWNMMLQEELTSHVFPALRQGLYGGAPMAPALVKSVTDAFGVDLFQAYGMTEMGPAITCLMEDEQLTKAGSAGKPLLNHEIRVVRTIEDAPSNPDDECEVGELGEIIVKGPSMMVEYYNQREATEAALAGGWYRSGDVGYFDEDGYLWISDRVKDMVISGGENIYSREVEDALFDHPGVLDVAVIGEPDEKWGERVVAVVVKKDPTLTAEMLDEFCKNSDRLARYKRPRRYEFVDQLPRNASGKLQKFLLRERTKNS